MAKDYQTCAHAEGCRLAKRCAHGAKNPSVPQPPPSETLFQSQRAACWYYREKR
jgi:hypothetical protein